MCFLKRVFSDLDDVFLPKDIDLDSEEMDETEREVEYFKRCENHFFEITFPMGTTTTKLPPVIG